LNAHPVLRAVLWMMGTLLSFSAMAVAGRELSQELDTFEILVYRSAVGLVIISLLLQQSGWGQVRTHRHGLHLVRNSAHFIGQFGWFYGIALIPLAEVVAIEFTAPIWAMFLAVIILGERLTGARIAAVVLGFVGMLLILRPGLRVVDPGALAVLVGAFGYGITYVLTKKLTRSDSPLCILFYMTVIQLPMALLPVMGSLTLPTLKMLPWVLVVGSTALAAHYCLTRAFALADATVVVPLDFLRLPLVALVGYLFYYEAIDPFVFIGAFLMLLGNYVSVRAATRPESP
jgi:drug/metabolite transporter (DMT)-like permease